MAAVAAAEEEQEQEIEDAQGDEDAASTAALDYMDSPSLLNSNAAGTTSRNSIHDHAASAEAVEQAEEPQPTVSARQGTVAILQQAEAAGNDAGGMPANESNERSRKNFSQDLMHNEFTR